MMGVVEEGERFEREQEMTSSCANLTSLPAEENVHISYNEATSLCILLLVSTCSFLISPELACFRSCNSLCSAPFSSFNFTMSYTVEVKKAWCKTTFTIMCLCQSTSEQSTINLLAKLVRELQSHSLTRHKYGLCPAVASHAFTSCLEHSIFPPSSF